MRLAARCGGFIIGALLSLQAAAADGIVFESTDTPPYWSESLQGGGMGDEMLRLLSRNAGVRYSIEYLPVKRYRNSVARYIVGDPDILISQKPRAIFPIGLFRSAFFYYKPHHDVIEFHSLADLNGHTLGVLRGTLEDSRHFETHGIKVEESDSTESLLKKLKRGRIDFCILVDGTGRYTIDKLFGAERDDFAYRPIPGSERPIALMVDMETPEGRAVAGRYRQVLDSTLKSAEYRGILERFYGKNNVPPDRAEILMHFLQYYSGTWGK